MIFEITKPITATLRVECNSKDEAIDWANRIVATIDDENGESINANKVEYFEAETTISEMKIIEIR